MAVHSNFLATCKKYLAKKRYCAQYSNFERDITGSSESYLFYYPPLLLKLSKCHSKRCLTCPYASSSQIDNNPLLPPFCKAYNVVYKISCKECNMSYIGENSTPLHLRINQHRSDSNKYDSSTIFNKSTEELKYFNLHKFTITNINLKSIKI